MSNSNSFAGINFGYDSEKIFKYRDENMCSDWKNIAEKEYMMCKIEVLGNNQGNYVINGNIKNHLKSFAKFQDIFIQFWATNKCTRGYSFNGSGLPFPNEEIAFENTTNKGVIKLLDGEFTFNIDSPNSYYTNMGTILNPPCVKYKFCDTNGKSMSKIYTIIIGKTIPYRSLNFPKKRDWNEGPLFYQNKDMPTCRNQFQILMDSKYPGKNGEEASNFWGGKPPR